MTMNIDNALNTIVARLENEDGCVLVNVEGRSFYWACEKQSQRRLAAANVEFAAACMGLHLIPMTGGRVASTEWTMQREKGETTEAGTLYCQGFVLVTEGELAAHQEAERLAKVHETANKALTALAVLASLDALDVSIDEVHETIGRLTRIADESRSAE